MYVVIAKISNDKAHIYEKTVFLNSKNSWKNVLLEQ